MLDKSDIKKLYESFGADPRRWPDDVREEALQCLSASDNNFSQLSRQAAELDAILDSAEQIRASDAFQDRILSLPDNEYAAPLSIVAHNENGGARALRRISGTYWQAAAGLVIAAVLGFVTGIQIPEEGDPVDMLDISAFVQGVTQDEEQLL